MGLMVHLYEIPHYHTWRHIESYMKVNLKFDMKWSIYNISETSWNASCTDILNEISSEILYKILY